MPLLTDKNGILEAILAHPGKIRKLWIEQGFERVFDEVIRETKARGIQFRVITKDEFFKRFRGTKSHICLERDDFSYLDDADLLGSLVPSSNPFLCAFDGVQDPQNLGNILRSAACLDTGAIIIPKDRACAVTDTVAHIAKGALEHVAVARVTNLVRYLVELKKAGVFCFGLDEKGDQSLWDVDLKGPVCLVFGGEDGLRRLTRETCDVMVRIPANPAFSSLNVATCFALSAYEVRRQRQKDKR
jgi:23S rRNA (guanosine2251-2'-O)-methyltransferase